MRTAQMGDQIQVHYVIRRQDGSVTSSRGRAPLQLTVGIDHHRLPGLGLALVGLAPGARATIRVPPERAYGSANPARVYRWSRNRFPTNATLGIGHWIRFRDDRGRNRSARILEVSDQVVIVDANHRWAGQALDLEVELLAIAEPVISMERDPKRTRRRFVGGSLRDQLLPQSSLGETLHVIETYPGETTLEPLGPTGLGEVRPGEGQGAVAASAPAPGANALPTPDQLVRALVHQAIPEGVELLKFDGLHCLFDAGGVLQYQCAAWLPEVVARQKIEGFLQQWQSQVVHQDDESLRAKLALNASWWQRLCGRSPIMEIDIRQRRPLPGAAQLSQLTVTLRCLGDLRQKSRQVLEQVGPVLLNSLRGYLLATAENRVQVRFPFDQPLRFASAPGGDESLAIDCRGRDISLGGIRFHSPIQPESQAICLFFPVAKGSPEETVSVAIAASVRQVLPDDSGGYLVGARFEFDPVLQRHHVLLIVDDPDEAGRLERMFAEITDLAWDLKSVARLENGLEQLAAGRLNVILLDLSLQRGHELETLRQVRAKALAVPVVVLAGPDQGPLALRALQEGAVDYLIKSQLDGNLLARTLYGTIERRRHQQAHDLKNERQHTLVELEKGRQKERYLAYHDALIGLPNRALFYDRLEQALTQAARQASELTVLFLDLDGFKAINDTRGHSTGDRLLQAVAERLQDCVRKTDTVARHGGDEFTILLINLTQPQAAVQVAEAILRALARPLVVAGQELFITASVGISVYPRDGADADTLVQKADTAMYHAKANGKNAYQVYHSSMKAVQALPGLARNQSPDSEQAC